MTHEHGGAPAKEPFFSPEAITDEQAYRELIDMLLPNGKCPKFETCDHPDKDNYYCHDFCPYIPSLETWLEELEELRCYFRHMKEVAS